MPALLAAIPLAVVLVGMGVLRVSAATMGAVGLAVALTLALVRFDLAAGMPISDVQAGTGALAEAVHSTAVILWIIVPALSLYEFQRRTGAIDRIREALTSLSDNRRIRAMLIAWFFGLFMEGAAGFGTPVALAAPLLVGLGYAPVRAVALALLGHAAGVSFGALGTPVIAQVEITGLAARDIAAATAVLHALAGLVLLLMMVRLADDGPLTRSDIGWVGLAALCFFVPSLLFAVLAGPELPTLGGALAGVGVFIAALRCRKSDGAGLDLRGLMPDLGPYVAILTLVLATRLIPAVQEASREIAFQWRLHETFGGSFEPLYHPGTLLLLGFLAAAVATGRSAMVPGAVAAALRRLLPVALALLAMLSLSRIMVHSGMIEALAEAASRVGPLWPLIAPVMGVLGTFITGSATASNILFTELQQSTATSLSLAPSVMAAAQGFGAGIGNVIAPHNIIAGSATVGLVGREGDILAQTARACAICAGIGGLALLIFTRL